MDANEYALQMTPASKALGLVIRKAEPMLTAKPRATTIKATKEKIINPKKGEPSSPLVAELSEPTSQAQPQNPTDIKAEINEREIKLRFGDRNYRVRGLQKNQVYDQLRINLLVSRGEALHVDTLELYNAKQRQTFIKLAASELSVEQAIIKKDLGKILLKLEALQDEQIEKNNTPVEKILELSQQEKEEALELLKDKQLLNRIVEDFHQCGMVGEETNLLMGYLAAVSRKLDKPLAIIIQSTSAAGKSSVMDAVLAMFPAEERVQFSAMTGQSLFYMGETRLKHKILAISEEEGVEQASYALKLLQSEGEVTIASTGKNATTGNLETQEYHVEGPVMLFLTTTAIDIDEELLNRCLVLTVNESGEQTEAIQQSQRTSQTLEGLLVNENKQQKITVHQNAQRLLRPLKVVNPFAEQLTFRSDQTRTRRDHMKYLTLIQSIAYLHQYQREIKTVTQNGNRIEYIEVTIEDIKTTNQLAHEVLGRTLDELPPQTRKLLTLIYDHTQNKTQEQGIERSDFRFSRKQLRDEFNWGDTALKVHLARLVDLDYLVAHNNGHRQRHLYELFYDGAGKEGELFLNGLIELEKLHCDANRSGQKVLQSVSGQGLVGSQSVRGWSV